MFFGVETHISAGFIEASSMLVMEFALLSYILLSRRIQVTFRNKVIKDDLQFVWDEARAVSFIEYGWDRIGAPAKASKES